MTMKMKDYTTKYTYPTNQLLMFGFHFTFLENLDCITYKIFEIIHASELYQNDKISSKQVTSLGKLLSQTYELIQSGQYLCIILTAPPTGRCNIGAVPLQWKLQMMRE